VLVKVECGKAFSDGLKRVVEPALVGKATE
jgi:hypothetical protein